jgi:uncharacterized protein (TIGR02996 family)
MGDLTQEALWEVKRLCQELRDALAHPPVVYGRSPPLGDFGGLASLIDQHGAGLALPEGVGLEYDPGVGQKVLASLERMMAVLGLSPAERSFVAALAERPGDEDTAAIFADWLLDQGRPEGAEAMRRATPQDGDVLVIRLPEGSAALSGGPARDELHEAIRRMAKRLQARGKAVTAVVLPHASDLEAMPPGRLYESLRGEPWSEAIAEGARLEEREACAELAEAGGRMYGGRSTARAIAGDIRARGTAAPGEAPGG